ncbi:hypothetical protein GDO81_018046 [Engystomops pustulosus]|uniref:Uncharacterized protein n=1 Tax=Engystomops pustulosus TaxID=76066 RepID=A0AAV7A4U9_ENGPU|nr:hypothetical protein GDO81_018046 [Engystomops pustulosus]
MAPSKAVPTLEAADGYIAVPVRFSEEKAPHHCFYATQEHLDDTRPRNRTLFVINIPGYITEGFKVAYIVFKKEFGIEKFSSALVISKEDNFIKAGIEKWISDYEASFIDVAALQAEIDKYMDKYDGKEKKVVIFGCFCNFLRNELRIPTMQLAISLEMLSFMFLLVIYCCTL